METRTAHALIRFGLGRKGTGPLPADPQAWLAYLSGQLPLPTGDSYYLDRAASAS